MKDCPEDVVRAGRDLIVARKMAANLSDQISDAIKSIKAAAPEMVSHGAKVMQMGEAISLLRRAQAAEGDIMSAHESLRRVLAECGVAQPTDDQVLSIR